MPKVFGWEVSTYIVNREGFDHGVVLTKGERDIWINEAWFWAAFFLIFFCVAPYLDA